MIIFIYLNDNIWLMSEAMNSRIEDDLKAIREDLDFIKANMVDKDSIMTEEDYEALLAYRKEKSSGNLIGQEQLEKELGI